MNRIHGNKIIKRRENQKHYASIQSYTESLKQDFYGICGYCGKNMNKIHCPAEKDHLIPESLAKKYGKPSLITDYNNLVYACRTCNQRKKAKWPFNHINYLNDGKKGYSDPASKDYDKHLEFNNDGKIIAKTSVGKYMFEIFDFENRYTESWFFISKMWEQVEEIDLKIEKRNDDLTLYKKYRELRKQIDQLAELLNKQKESF